jgi:hypothetical protein
MDEGRLKFIRETPPTQDALDWKERLLKPETGSALRLDLMYVGGQSVVDIILGHVSDKDIDPHVIEAFNLQYPSLSHDISFVEEVRKFAGDPERLRGFFSGIKGKLFEVEYRDYLNVPGHLPIGYAAELSEKANQPGVDILIKDSHGHIHEQLQAKAYETLQGVKEHIERYPEYNQVIIPSDQITAANADGLGHYVEAAPITNHVLDSDVHGALNDADAVSGFHLPLVGFSLLAGEMVFCLWKGKQVSVGEIIERGGKLTVAAIAAQTAILLSHATWVGVPVGIVTRALLARYSKAKDFIKLLREKREWVRIWITKPSPMSR